MAERELPKLNTRVRFPSPAPRFVLFRHQWAIAQPLMSAFSHLGFEIVENPSVRDLKRFQKNEILCAFNNIHLEIKKPHKALYFKNRLNALGAPVIFWDRDGPSHMGEKLWRMCLLRLLPFMDIYATHTLQDAGGFCRDVLYLPNAAANGIYNLNGKTLADLRDEKNYQYDVSFFGRLDANRWGETRVRCAFFEKLQKALAEYGIALWAKNNDFSLNEQIEIIQTSKINLSALAGCDFRYRKRSKAGKPISDGLPERCYGVPNCGGFLLSDWRNHALDDFTPGEDFAFFTDFKDCVKQIRFFLNHFERTREIAENAFQTVQKRHLYEHRAQKVAHFVYFWKQKKRFIPTPELFPR